MRRGDVYFADLSPTIGSEQGGTRPVVIIQNNTGNEHSPTVIVALITSQMKPKLPTHVKVCERDKLSQASVIMAEQVRTIDKHRLRKFVCRLCDKTMEKLNVALETSLEIKNKSEKKGDEQMDNLMTFNNEEFGEIRTVIKDGEPWFCLIDVCKALEILNPSVVAQRLDEDERTKLNLGRAGETNFITESGLYATVLRSDKPKAKQFRKWVTSEVLPSIRKTGTYQRKMTPEEMMRVQLGMLDGHEERISKLEGTMNIDYGQQRVLEKEVAKVVIEALGGKDSSAYKELSKKVFSECNRDVKDYFNVNSRNNIPRVRFDDAVEYIREWKPCTNTRVAIRELNEGRKAG